LNGWWKFQLCTGSYNQVTAFWVHIRCVWRTQFCMFFAMTVKLLLVVKWKNVAKFEAVTWLGMQELCLNNFVNNNWVKEFWHFDASIISFKIKSRYSNRAVTYSNRTIGVEYFIAHFLVMRYLAMKSFWGIFTAIYRFSTLHCFKALLCNLIAQVNKS